MRHVAILDRGQVIAVATTLTLLAAPVCAQTKEGHQSVTTKAYAAEQSVASPATSSPTLPLDIQNSLRSGHALIGMRMR